MIQRFWRAVRYPLFVLCLVIAVVLLYLMYQDWRPSVARECPDACMAVAALLFFSMMTITLWLICAVEWSKGNWPVPLLLTSACIAPVVLVYVMVQFVQLREPLRIPRIPPPDVVP